MHSQSSEPMILLSQTTPDEHPPAPQPCQWPALITLSTLVKFQLVWRRLRDVVLFLSCLVKHGLTHAPLLREYRFQVTRVAPSTLQLRSKGRPALLPSNFPSSFIPSTSLPPSFPASHPPSRSLPPISPFLSTFLHPLSALLHPGGSIESRVSS